MTPPILIVPPPLQAEAGAIKEAARLLASAQNPVIVADYVGRNNDAVLSLVGLADLLSIPVIDLGARHFYISNLPIGDAARTLQRIMDLAGAFWLMVGPT